ncbi:hypothetical protein BCR36DRAFT_580600 [Piromyces finnis]|uniref:Uncharacterized protein n=1 Tax=Piromyces finnis TaxID=1754191 RepID=A0A1Y1VJJ3_9FUNG|nr:hypothetical protein BCR36DRAFT_580600 [Piromyces finnis]|eukprot:ORX57191.1 hypothetical protein BCR36DRAFT_580600 [Piromyces finnis]
MLERRCDPEIETLPPYSPPSSTFLAENENDNTHSLISPPSYHQFPTVDISPQGTMINTSTTNSPNILTDSILHSINVNTTNNSITTANRSTNQNLLSANPRLSFISTQSSLLIPNTPPPSYSQPTTPYLYDIENENGENNNTSNNDDNDNEALLPPIPTNSNVTQPPVAHPHNNSRTYNLVNNVTTMNVNRYSTLSNPEDRSDQNNNNSNRSSYRRSTISLRRSSLRHSITLDSNSNINLSMESSPPPH